MRISSYALSTPKKWSAFFKTLFTLFFLFTCSAITANDLPNKCSKDQNINEFTILSYHEIADKSEVLDSNYAVSPAHFDEQMRWLMDNGYHFISVNDILEHRNNAKPLPKKAVLISFDDGYHSVYANAFPIIKKYKIPVLMALVGSWLNEKEKIDFNKHSIARSKFLSQKEIQEMLKSGLVEIASHSYLFHEGVQGNPQGNMQPAITTRQWLSEQKIYENEQSYKERVHKDLLQNSTFLEKYTGQKPRVMVWPYGHYNMQARRIAESLGMSVGLTLDDGSNTAATPLWGFRRILVKGSMTLRDLHLDMLLRNANLTDDDRTTKAAHIDLDYIYDANPQQQEKNLGAFLDRIKDLGVNTIYLQAFADPDANGAADYVYFPNRNIPMRADLFNRVAWQIATRTQVKRIYAWMPMIAWQLPQENPAAKDVVVTLQVDAGHLNMGYPRLSPFSADVQKVIRELYEDLAKSAYINGILFHDDVTLSDFEDDSEAARVQYKKWGLHESVTKIRADKEEFQKWTRLKTQYLDEFAMELAKIVAQERPGIKTARNLYAQVALSKDAQEWYAQSLSESIKYYDYTAIMAMPYMEQEKNATEFYDKIIHNVSQVECGLERTVMELQSVNWRKDNEPIPAKELEQTIKYLYDSGVHHIAYYPDDVFNNTPNADMIRETFSQKPVRMETFNPSKDF